VFTTGNLLVLAISFLMILVFRRFDRRRMELSKIKKYSERIIGEYEELAKVKQREFKDATIELDLLTKKARLTLQTADGSLETISKLLSEIDARRDELSAIAADMKNTEHAAREVRRLQSAITRDESSIRKLLATAEGSRTVLGEIEKRLPAIEKSFHTRIEDKATAWTKEIEARELPRLEKSLETARIRLGEEFEAACADADSRILTRLSAFEARIEAAEEKLSSTLGQHIQTLSSKASAVLDEFRQTRSQHLEEFSSELESRATAAAGSIEETSLAIEVIRADVLSLNDQAASIDGRIKQFVQESKLFDRADRMMERLQNEIQTLTSQMEKCSSEKKAVLELEKRLASVRDERAAVEGLFARLTERKKELQSIENHAAAITGEIDRIEASLQKQQPLFEKTRLMIERMQEELDLAEAGIKKTEALRVDLDEIEAKGGEVRKMLDGISGDKKSLVTLENRIATMGDSVIRLEQSLAASKDEIDNKAATIGRTIDEFTRKSAIFDKAENLASRLDSEIEALDKKILEVREERDRLGHLKDDLAAVRKDEDAVRTMLATMEKRRDELVAIEKRVEQAGTAVEQFETLLEKKKLDAEKGLEKDSARIREEISRLEKTLSQVREKSLIETQNSIGSLKSDIKEMDKRIREFAKETALFERADKLSGKLNEDIAELNTRISQLRVDKKDLLELGKQIESIRKEEAEIARMSSSISNDRKQFADLEKRMGELARTSASVETRMQELSRASSLLQPVETRLAEVADRQSTLQKSLEELAVKDAKLNQSHNRFKKAESFAEKLENQLELLKANFEQVQKDKGSLETHVEAMQEKSRKLIENEVRINKLLSHFEQMNGMLSDVERRTAQLTIAQDRLSKMENSIRELSGHADVRIEDLSSLSRKIDSFFGIGASTQRAGTDPAKGKASAKSVKEAPTDERKLNEMIFKMHDQGMDPSQIAHIVRRPISDVELRLHVRKE